MNKTAIVILVLVVLGILFWVYKSKDEVSEGPATVLTQTVVRDTSSAAAVQAGTKSVTWQTSNYPDGVGVNINLVRKVSDSPREYVLVRALATNTANDGQESWTPMEGENTNDLYVEVTCGSAYEFTKGCNITGEAILVN